MSAKCFETALTFVGTILQNTWKYSWVIFCSSINWPIRFCERIMWEAWAAPTNRTPPGGGGLFLRWAGMKQAKGTSKRSSQQQCGEVVFRRKCSFSYYQQQLCCPRTVVWCRYWTRLGSAVCSGCGRRRDTWHIECSARGWLLRYWWMNSFGRILSSISLSGACCAAFLLRRVGGGSCWLLVEIRGDVVRSNPVLSILSRSFFAGVLLSIGLVHAHGYESPHRQRPPEVAIGPVHDHGYESPHGQRPPEGPYLVASLRVEHAARTYRAVLFYLYLHYTRLFPPFPGPIGQQPTLGGVFSVTGLYSRY